MYLKCHFRINTSLSVDKCSTLISQKIGETKRFSGKVKKDLSQLSLNFGGIWGLTIKTKMKEIDNLNQIDIRLYTKLDRTLKPSCALLLSLITLIVSILITIAYFIEVQFLRLIIIALVPVASYLIAKISFGKEKATPFDKEINYFENLFQGEVEWIKYNIEEEKKPNNPDVLDDTQ